MTSLRAITALSGAAVARGIGVAVKRDSYPSGHVTASTAIAVAATSEMAYGLTPRQRSFVWATVAGVSIAVGWSRLYLDKHWIDDVVGGRMAGVAIGLGSVSLVAHRS